MPGASDKNGHPHYGLTPREVDLTIQAMITLAENNVKPDFEKLAKMAKYKDANAASKNWYFTDRKLKGVGTDVDGEATNDNKAGGKRGKRQADDMPQAPPAKRGRKRKTVQDAAEEGEDEEQKLVVKGEAEDI
ncbi:hypothetical protein INS49_001641 [Diaporthe citri]|uniref:uncharacterized protein n=1 Tax=Diaporthe citri TaxID=83186 RepID=UPI001C7F3A1B|nr:uncharacterized protein INS49_001641 [Diaporthe citri]KAG6367452.1 hypothetical protein INS49_001641 [Diaporthe citri]